MAILIDISNLFLLSILWFKIESFNGNKDFCIKYVKQIMNKS